MNIGKQALGTEFVESPIPPTHTHEEAAVFVVCVLWRCYYILLFIILLLYYILILFIIIFKLFHS